MATMEMFRRDDNARAFEAGQTIFKEGDAGDVMYVLVEGEIDLSVRGIVVETLAVGSMFGEMALLGKEPRTATAIAKTNGTITPIDEKRFLFLVQQTPYFALQLMRTMAERLRNMDQRL